MRARCPSRLWSIVCVRATAWSFTVDADSPMGRATLAAGGISFHRLAGYTGQPYDRKGEYTLAPEMENAIRDLRLPMTRIYGVGDEPFGIEGGIDRAAELCQRTGIPAGSHGAGTGNARCFDDDRARKTGRGPCAIPLQKGYQFRHWEVANEPYFKATGAAHFLRPTITSSMSRKSAPPFAKSSHPR